MKSFLYFLLILFISCNKNLKTENDYLKFSELLISKIKTKNFENIDKMFNDIDVIKSINQISDSLGYKNETERKIFHTKFDFSRQASQYFKNISRKLKGKIEITNHYFVDNEFHVIICSELDENLEGTELILIEKNDKIMIDNYLSYTTGLDMKNNFIEYSLYKLNDPSFSYSNKLLNKCLSLTNNGQNKEAYDLYMQIPSEHASLINFLAIKYRIIKNILQELTPEEVDDTYIQIITSNYDNKGFRYNKGSEYYQLFGQDSIAEIYKDSLYDLIKDKYFIDKISNQQLNK